MSLTDELNKKTIVKSSMRFSRLEYRDLLTDPNRQFIYRTIEKLILGLTDNQIKQMVDKLEIVSINYDVIEITAIKEFY